MHIFSSSNPKIKRLKQLSTKKSLCKKENIFLVEGEKEITFALASNYRLKELYVVGTLPASLVRSKIGPSFPSVSVETRTRFTLLSVVSTLRTPP